MRAKMIREKVVKAKGFTLLEVLIALIIFAIAFGAIATIFQTSLRQSTTADMLFDATYLAERQMTRVGSELPLVVGETSGMSPGGLRWQTDVELATPVPENSAIALYRVTVDVKPEDDDRSHITLQTLRMGPAP